MNEWDKVLAIVFVFCAFLFGYLIGRGPSPNSDSEKPTVEKPTLASRINDACKPGYELYDWTVGDEFNPLPKGVIMVECQAIKPIGEYGVYKTYKVAISR